MDCKSEQSDRRNIVLFLLNVIIECLDVAEKVSSITPAKAVFSTVRIILTMMRVSALPRFEDLLQADKIHAGFDDG